MKAQVKVGRIAGISIGLHYSWFIIALLIALSLAPTFPCGGATVEQHRGMGGRGGHGSVVLRRSPAP